MIEPLADRVRQDRSSGAVLKLRLSNMRARSTTVLVFVFEGAEDVGPYSAWISRIDDTLRFEPLPAQGKGQVLDLRRRLQFDMNGLNKGVYFFVDRDFDELRGQPYGDDLYCTPTYSIENELVCEITCLRVLTDEFRCTAENSDRDSVLQVFRAAANDFATVMREPNRRIFRARKLKINPIISESITRYANIEVDKVTSSHNAGDLVNLIKLAREPTPDECARLDAEFSVLEPLLRHRGKFWAAFFFRWLEQLAIQRRSNLKGLFSERRDIGFSTHNLSLTSLAVRSAIPDGLRAFVERAAMRS